MDSAMQLLLSGLASGAIYGLVAMGFSLMWQTSQTINFAQGEFVMMPAFLVLAFMNFAGLQFGLSIMAGGVVAVLILGPIFKKLIVDPMLKYGTLPLVVATLALSIFLREAVRNFYSAQDEPFPSLFGSGVIKVFGADISIQSLSVFIIAGACALALDMFLNKTRTGRAMQATAQNRAVARILGVPVERMVLYAFCINAILVTLASVLITPIYLASFTNGEQLGLAAFSAAIIGGFNQVRGALLGGVILGVADNFCATYVSADYRDAVPLLLMVVVILFRPEGLLGRREERTV